MDFEKSIEMTVYFDDKGVCLGVSANDFRLTNLSGDHWSFSKLYVINFDPTGMTRQEIDKQKSRNLMSYLRGENKPCGQKVDTPQFYLMARVKPDEWRYLCSEPVSYYTAIAMYVRQIRMKRGDNFPNWI